MLTSLQFCFSRFDSCESEDFLDFLLLLKTFTIYWQRQTGAFKPNHTYFLCQSCDKVHASECLKCSLPAAVHLHPLSWNLQDHWSTGELILGPDLWGCFKKWLIVVSLLYSHCLCVLTSCRCSWSLLFLETCSAHCWVSAPEEEDQAPVQVLKLKKNMDLNLTDFMCLCVCDSRAGSMSALQNR